MVTYTQSGNKVYWEHEIKTAPWPSMASEAIKHRHFAPQECLLSGQEVFTGWWFWIGVWRESLGKRVCRSAGTSRNKLPGFDEERIREGSETGKDRGRQGGRSSFSLLGQRCKSWLQSSQHRLASNFSKHGHDNQRKPQNMLFVTFYAFVMTKCKY